MPSVDRLEGIARPERAVPVVVGFRASGFFLEDVWLPLRQALPDHSPTDILREAIVARFALEVRDDSGERPQIRAYIANQPVDLADYLGINRVRASEPLRFAALRNKARREPDDFQNLSVRLSGEFLTDIWNPLREALPTLSPAELLKQALVLRAALEAPGPDDKPLKIEVSFVDGQGKRQTEDLATHLGLGSSEQGKASSLPAKRSHLRH